MVWLRRDLKGQGYLLLDQIAQSPIQPFLEHFQGSACTSTHNVSALIIDGIHKNCDWAGKLQVELCPQSNLILIFLSLQGVEGNAKAKAKSGRKS